MMAGQISHAGDGPRWKREGRAEEAQLNASRVCRHAHE